MLATRTRWRLRSTTVVGIALLAFTDRAARIGCASADRVAVRLLGASDYTIHARRGAGGGGGQHAAGSAVAFIRHRLVACQVCYTIHAQRGAGGGGGQPTAGSAAVASISCAIRPM